MNLKEKKKIQVEQMMREEICAAIRRLMCRQAYKDMKMSDIATEAGVSKGTLYNYFSSKEELVRFFLDEKEAEYDGKLKALVTADMPSAREKLIKYFELAFSFADNNEGWSKLFFEYIQETATIDEERDVCLKKFQKYQMAIVQEGIEKDGWIVNNPEVKVWLMALLVMKVTYMRVVDKDNCPSAKDIIEGLVDSLDAQINSNKGDGKR